MRSAHQRAALLASAALAALAAALTASCKTEKSVAAYEWADVDSLIKKPAVDDEADAVIVSRERRLLSQLIGYESRTEIHSHDVMRLLTEGGFDHATMTVQWPEKGRLIHLDARSIAPDGTITPLDAEQLFAAEVKLDEDEGGHGEVRRFTFPRVEVGAFVELAYTIEINDALYTRWSDRVADDLPVLDYRCEIVVDENAAHDIRILNSDAKATVEQRDGMKHISFRMQNVPAIVREPYAPEWRAAEPWWIYRTVAYKEGKNVWYTNYDWNDALRGVRALFKDKSLSETAPEIDVAACKGDPVCIIVAASDKTRELTAFTGFSDAYETRKLPEVLASKTADAGEKAVLLFAILKKAGIDAHLAGIARRGTNAIPRDFPSLQWLNHTLVVAVFDDKMLWIDPSCEHCGPGYLPSWVPIGEEALVAWPKPVFNDVELVNGWWQIAGTPAPVENLEHAQYTVEIEEDGDAKIALDWSMTGEYALLWRERTRTDDEHEQRRDAVRLVRNLSPAAQLTSSTKVECEPGRGFCKQRIEAFFPAYAWTGDDGVRVPLDPLRFTFQLRREDDEPRKTDVVIMAPGVNRDEIHVIAPKGKRIEGLPQATAQKAGLVELAVTSSSSPGKAVVRRELKWKAGNLKKRDVDAMDRVIDAGAAVGSRVVKLVDDPNKGQQASATP